MAQLPSLADAPGTLREYETIYILRPDTVNDKVAEVNQRVKGIIESMGGSVLNVDNWGKRKLAYEIKKELKGIYLFWQYLGSPEVVAEFERNMRMLDQVIRYMTVMVGRDLTPESRPSEVTDETYQKAASTAADEEELMLRRTEDAGGEAQADGDQADGEGAKAEASSDEASSAEASSAEASSADGDAGSDDNQDDAGGESSKND